MNIDFWTKAYLFFAFCILRNLLFGPTGLLVNHLILPSYPIFDFIKFAMILIEISFPEPKFRGSVFLYFFAVNINPSTISSI